MLNTLFSHHRWMIGIASAAMIAAMGFFATGIVHAGSPQANGYTIVANTPGLVRQAQYLGAADTTQTLTLTVWLKLHNESQLQ
jgi:hypothetical protein